MLDQTTQTSYPPRNDPSTAELVNRAVSQVSTLVRSELALAKAELAEKAKQAGTGGGLLGAAGVLGMYAVGLLLALVVALLDLVWPLWVAILVVLVLVLATVATLALVGRQRLKSATPAAPTEASSSMRADLDAVRDAFRHGRAESEQAGRRGRRWRDEQAGDQTGRRGRRWREDDAHHDPWSADWLRDDQPYGSQELHQDRMGGRQRQEATADEQSPYGDRAYGGRHYGEDLYDETHEQVGYGDRPFGDKSFKDSPYREPRPDDETNPGWR
jgi:uncharacterized membrane protein YqjE